MENIQVQQPTLPALNEKLAYEISRFDASFKLVYGKVDSIFKINTDQPPVVDASVQGEDFVSAIGIRISQFQFLNDQLDALANHLQKVI